MRGQFVVLLRTLNKCEELAERVGFEPTCRLPDKTLSRRPRYDHFGTSPLGEHSIIARGGDGARGEGRPPGRGGWRPVRGRPASAPIYLLLLSTSLSLFSSSTSW